MVRIHAQTIRPAIPHLTADNRRAAGVSDSAAKVIGYLCWGVAGLILLYGLYLIIPQFH